nr:DMT family transporter [Sedimentibacter sp.]
MNEKKLGSLMTGIGVFIFGINFVSMKFLVDHMPPFTLVFLRFAIASIFLHIMVKVKEVRSKTKTQLDKKDRILVLITGFFGIAVYYFFQSLALIYIDASLAALVCATIPIFTLLANVVINKKKAELFLVINFIITILGVLLVLDIRMDDKFNMSKIIGCIFTFLAVFSWIIYTLKTHELQKKYDNIYLLYKQTLAGTVSLLMVAIFDIAEAREVIFQSDILVPLIENLIFVGVVCSALGYFLYIYGMERIGIETASLYMNLIPVVTAVISYLFLNEVMTVRKVTGIIIVISSLYMVALWDLKQSKTTAKEPSEKVA